MFGDLAADATCIRCTNPKNEKLRAEWGCDDKLAVPIGRVDCVCEGDGCEICDHKGRFLIYRCPWSLIGDQERAICQAVSLLEVGVLPTSRGWAEHPAKFCDAVSLVSNEKAKIDQARFNAERNKAHPKH